MLQNAKSYSAQHRRFDIHAILRDCLKLMYAVQNLPGMICFAVCRFSIDRVCVRVYMCVSACVHVCVCVCVAGFVGRRKRLVFDIIFAIV